MPSRTSAPARGVNIKEIKTSADRDDLLSQLDRRDWQLWTLTLVVLLVLGSFISLFSLWKSLRMGESVWEEWVRTVLLIGFVGLTLLFCVHVVFQQATVKRLRRHLMTRASLYRNVETDERIENRRPEHLITHSGEDNPMHGRPFSLVVVRLAATDEEGCRIICDRIRTLLENTKDSAGSDPLVSEFGIGSASCPQDTRVEAELTGIACSRAVSAVPARNIGT